MAYESNLAYDLSRFDRQARQRRASQTVTTQVDFTPAPEKNRPQTAKVGWAGTDKSIGKLRRVKLARVFAVCIMMLGMLATVIFNQAKLNEINKQINTVSTQITKLKSENTQKQLELERRVNIRTAEEIARNEYGMVDVNNAQVTYVSVDSDEVSQRMDNGLWSQVKLFFEQIYAYISGE